MGRSRGTRIPLDQRVRIIGGWMSAHPELANHSVQYLWKRITQETAYDASDKTFYTDYAKFQASLVSNLTGRMARALLLLDAEIARLMDDDERPLERLTDILREQRAILCYAAERPSAQSAAPAARNRYAEERSRWQEGRSEPK